MKVDDKKALLRRNMAEKRRVLAQKSGKEASSQACQNLITLLGEKNPSSVGGYYAIRSEINPYAVMEYCWKEAIPTALPHIYGPYKMRFHGWQGDEAELIREKMGTVAPAQTAPLIWPSFLIVPLLAFDLRGYRLGYGGGFYDNFIAEHPEGEASPFTVGIAFEGQLCEEVPIEAHDMPLDAVVTEKKTRRFSSSAQQG